MQQTQGKRMLQYGLGILWVIDGLLQMQPNMFTSDFYALYPSKVMESVLQSATDDQPSWLAQLMEQGIRLWGHFPILFNVGAIIIQLLIGVLLIQRRSPKLLHITLWVSIIWGMGIWIYGEGLGGLFSDIPNYLDGFPGAAALYVIGAGLLLLPNTYWLSGRISRAIRIGLGVYWALMALFQALPAAGYWESDGLMSQIANVATLPQPYMLSAPVQAFALSLGNHSVIWNAFIIIMMLLLSLGSFATSVPRWFMWIFALWLIGSWWFGQDFGGIFSGMSTDLNSIPLIALFTIISMKSRQKLLQRKVSYRAI